MGFSFNLYTVIGITLLLLALSGCVEESAWKKGDQDIWKKWDQKKWDQDRQNFKQDLNECIATAEYENKQFTASSSLPNGYQSMPISEVPKLYNIEGNRVWLSASQKNYVLNCMGMKKHWLREIP